MRRWTQRLSRPNLLPQHGARLLVGLAVAGLMVPAVARAQYRSPETERPMPIGEKYHVEIAGSLWNPGLAGQISSEEFGIIGDKIDFVGDLGFAKTRFKDLRVVLRPSRKAKFKIQHTPVEYTAETALRRTIVFNGQRFDLALPISSTFKWNVWRLGYEYDFVYQPWGYVGMILEARYTEMTAELKSPIISEFSTVRAPLPALGVTGRVYVMPEVAVNFEVTGFKVPDVDPRYGGNYYDWDINGTFNINNNAGIQVGWRRMTTTIIIENDLGDLKFQGLWFGAALRY